LSEHPGKRYQVTLEDDRSWSIIDTTINSALRDSRIITGLEEAQAKELVDKLNAPGDQKGGSGYP
jgi:hypothetical protein